MQKVVLVTGASSGVGQAVVKAISERGHRVFGASRSATSAGEIPGVEMLPLDVCSDDSVTACICAIEDKAGRLNVLVNSAGYVLEGAVEETTVDEAKAQFETNFFGAVRMVKAALPLMRKQGDGQIINISSGAGFVGFPFYAFYNASKHALEGYTEALRYEVKPFNIRVSLVQLGLINTNLMTNKRASSRPIAQYDPWRKRMGKYMKDGYEKASSPRVAAEAILNLVEDRSPRLRTMKGYSVGLLGFLRWVLPDGLFEQALRRTVKLDSKE